ncbi:hypothetical protein ACFOYW_03545 [Gryllotalpicola reticulitermitis]|uniref:Uncharacterized protein n=1 Tax=Gryllotalpicola reticulitermitis TaxID=1184153 RepID=A0ABV8Q4L5_9MICO
MLLKLIARRLRAQGQRGSALVAVIGLLGVVMIVSLVIGGTTVHALGYTAATRASVQAEASAEAGVSYQQAQFTAGSCSPAYSTAASATPHYSVAVYYTTAATPSAWVAGCPTAGAGDTYVRTVSTGYASTQAVAGQATGQTRYVEAVYPYIDHSVTLNPTGAAIFAYSSKLFTGSGNLIATGPVYPTVLIKYGSPYSGSSFPSIYSGANQSNITACENGSQIQGNIVVQNGDLLLQNCAVARNVWVENGSLYTSWTEAISGDADVWGTANLLGTTISGSAWSSGPMNFHNGGVVKGNATGNAITLGTDGGASISAATKGGGTYDTPPTVPNWYNFAFNASDWTGLGYTVKTLTASQCTNGWGTTGVSTAYATGSVVIDARACPHGVKLSSGNNDGIALNGNLAIIGTAFDVESGAFTSTSGTPKVWLITPDSTVESPTAPTCTASATGWTADSSSGMTTEQTELANGLTLTPAKKSTANNISLMVYTPCPVNIGGNGGGVSIQGQIFSGSVNVANGSNMTWIPIGLPGANLDTGTSTGGGAASASLIGSTLSVRDLSTAG